MTTLLRPAATADAPALADLRARARPRFAEAVRQDLPVRVGALKESRSNAFYSRHGFRLVGSTEWDHHYLWHPAAEALGSVVRR